MNVGGDSDKSVVAARGARRANDVHVAPYQSERILVWSIDSFSNMPVEHDGANAFKFRAAFREAIKIDFRIFWDHSLTVIERLCRYRREFFPEA